MGPESEGSRGLCAGMMRQSLRRGKALKRVGLPSRSGWIQRASPAGDETEFCALLTRGRVPLAYASTERREEILLGRVDEVHLGADELS